MIIHMYSIDPVGDIILRFAHFHLCCGLVGEPALSQEKLTCADMHGAIMQVSVAIKYVVRSRRVPTLRKDFAGDE